MDQMAKKTIRISKQVKKRRGKYKNQGKPKQKSGSGSQSETIRLSAFVHKTKHLHQHTRLGLILGNHSFHQIIQIMLSLLHSGKKHDTMHDMLVFLSQSITRLKHQHSSIHHQAEKGYLAGDLFMASKIPLFGSCATGKGEKKKKNHEIHFVPGLDHEI